MTTLADLVAAYTREPSATVYLDGRRWYAISKLSFHQKFKEQIATGTIGGRDPPTTPRIGMAVSWTWGYNGIERAGFTGEVSGFTDFSYPDRWSLQCNDVLWRADKSSQVLQTSPLNDILASAAVRYLLTHYGGISASRVSIPALSASGAAWVGIEWTLGKLTPVQWGDTDTQSGGTTALKAAAEICGALGYWLYADAGGIIRAKQMERRPSTTAREVFRRAINLLIQGAPERQQSYENVYNQTTVRGANTGVDGAQLYDQYRTTSALLPAGVYRDFPFSSFLLEYENAADAGVASVTEVAKRLLNIVSRIPDVVPLRAKADPDRKVGDTVGIVDTGILLSTQRNFFIYQIDRTLDLTTGAFDDALLLDGGTGSTGFTTVPPPDASFSWSLMAETADGDAVVEVSLDGSAATSPSGEIVTWAWSTSTTTYAGTPNSASGITAMFVFLASSSPATITLTVTDTTSKTSTITIDVDLTGADTRPPLVEVVSAAAGAAWYVTPDGGATWNIETSNGDAISVGTIGAGADDRASGTAGSYGLLATRGSGGAGGLRQTLTALATASTNLVSNAGAITSNIWVNEANPARVWFAIGTAVYRSVDGGVTKTAMHAAPATVTWIMEDAAVDNSVFLLAGADMLNATDPTVGWAVLYPGPIGATARQFVRARDGQVTWIGYTGAPAGEALQRVETGAAADFSTTDVRSLALDRQASSLRATLYAVTGDDPAQLWSFDGLTGLSAVASSQTFPAGATVQHILTSRLFDVIYTADFDSIGAGQGALRKYLPIPDQLLLWKSLASGQQGHMLGLGGALQATATILMLPSGATGSADKLWILDARTGAWAGKALPAASKSDWQWLEANPFDSNKLLLFRYTGSGDNALYYSADFGDNWATVFSNLVTNNDSTGKNVQWSLSFGSEWIMSRSFTTNQRRLLRGTDATYAETTLTGGSEIFMGAGLNGDAVWLDISGDVRVTDSGGATTGPFAEGLGNGFFFLRSGTRQMAHARTAAENTIFVSNDYAAGTYTEILTTGARSFLGVLASGTIICGGRAAGVQEIADAWATAVVTTVAFSGSGIGAVATDKQTQTFGAAIVNPGDASTLQPAVRDPESGAWALLARPPLATTLANRIEIIGG